MIFLRVFIPFALGYFLSYLFRVINSAIAPYLVEDLHLGEGQLGLISSVYFLTFALFQLPLGLLLDRWGPRRVSACLLIVAALGAIIYAIAQNTPMLILGRGLIGLGMASGLMAAFKAYSVWLERDKIPLATGIHMAIGGLGAIVGGAPSEVLVSDWGWRNVFWLLAGVSFIVSLCVYLIVPRRGENSNKETLSHLISGFLTVVRGKPFFRVMPLCAAAQGVFLALHTLWAGPWLQNVAQLETGEAAQILSLYSLALLAGFMILGSLASWSARFGYNAMFVAFWSIVISAISLAAIIWLPVSMGIYAWYVMIFFGSAGVLCFPAVVQCYDLSVSGRVNTALNFFVFAAAFAVQWLVGEIIEFQLDSGSNSHSAYNFAFMLTFIFEIIAIGWFLLAFRNSVSWKNNVSHQGN